MLRQSNVSHASPLSVELHRQNGVNHCGAACVQMIASALGEPADQVNQSVIFESARPSTPACGPRDWFMSPLDIEKQLARVLRSKRIVYTAHDFATAGEALLELVTKTSAGWPACLLGEGGAHWIVVHGTRRDDRGRLYLDIRDPWPPITGSIPRHATGDCMEREYSAAWHMVFPAGLEFRVCPNQIRGPWYNRFVVVTAAPVRGGLRTLRRTRVPGGRESTATGTRPNFTADTKIPTRPQALLAAQTAAHMAGRMGWAPLQGEEFVAESMMMVKAGDWYRQGYCPLRGEARCLVELHRRSSPSHILAMAILHGRSGSVLEMLAPSGARAWIEKFRLSGLKGGEEAANAQPAVPNL